MRFNKAPSGLLVPRGPEIHVPKYLDAEVTVPPVGIAGYIGWELIRAGKVIRHSGGVHHNMLLNVGMDRFAASPLPSLLAYGQVGTSGVAPAFTDVALGAPVATAIRPATQILGSTYVAGPPDYWYRRWSYSFTETFANGNLTEFGTMTPAGPSETNIRQLLKDLTGTPTTIVKTNLDQLLITFELRIYPPTVDVATIVDVSGVNYDVVTRAQNANSAFAWAQVIGSGWSGYGMPHSLETDVLVARTASLGNGTAGTDGTPTGYVSGNYYIENKCVWDPAASNYPTGIGSFNSWSGDTGSPANGTLAMFQHSFTPKLPKTNTKKLTMYFRRHWARYP
jgi:hypothetical protein